jgi:hypothetical protein
VAEVVAVPRDLGLSSYQLFAKSYGSFIGLADLLPRLQEIAERNRTAAGPGPVASPNPVEDTGLSLPTASYVGVYASEHWGTFRVAHRDGRLTAARGNLPNLLKSTGSDRFQIGLDARTWRDAQFEVAGGRVTAVVIHWNDHGKARFTRKGP